MKSIVRIRKNSNYVVMDKTFLQDDSLSWKAKGIMSYMLSMPDDWTFYTNELIKHSTDGEASFRSGFKELQDGGYVKRFPVRKSNKIERWETIVLENPLLAENQEVGNQEVGNQEVGNQLIGNQALLINECTKNDITNNNNIPYAEIVNHLNEKAGKKFKHTTRKTRDLIRARWNEGNRLEDFKQVIDICCKKWKGQVFGNGQFGDEYLRPSTLFNGKFDERLNLTVKRDAPTHQGKSLEQLQHERELREMEERLKEHELSRK